LLVRTAAARKKKMLFVVGSALAHNAPEKIPGLAVDQFSSHVEEDPSKKAIIRSEADRTRQPS
jgi:hypothetical protein